MGDQGFDRRHKELKLKRHLEIDWNEVGGEEHRTRRCRPDEYSDGPFGCVYVGARMDKGAWHSCET